MSFPIRYSLFAIRYSLFAIRYSLFQELLCRVERHGRRVRHVERADCAGQVEAGKRGDGLAGLLAQALALRPEHQRYSVACKTGLDRDRPVGIEPDGLEAGLMQLAKRFGEVLAPRSGRSARVRPTRTWPARRIRAGCAAPW